MGKRDLGIAGSTLLYVLAGLIKGIIYSFAIVVVLYRTIRGTSNTSLKANPMRSPATGDHYPLPRSYDAAPAWMKRAMVDEGLMGRVYAYGELKALGAPRRGVIALHKFIQLTKYRPELNDRSIVFFGSNGHASFPEPASYIDADRRIKKLMVDEGLLDKVYRDRELLDSCVSERVELALQQFKGLKKYRARV